MLITAGATEAIAAALLALLEPGDEVIAFEPYYDSYVANIAMAGAVRVPLTLLPPDFRPDLDRLESLISDKTRLLLLNSPHNPTGMVLTAAETEAIARIAIDHDLLVITDEAYEHLTFDREHIPFATIPGMRERTVSIGSAGKTFSFTGWKVGWATGTPRTRLRRPHDQAVPHLRLERPVPVRGGGGARPPRRVLHQHGG